MALHYLRGRAASTVYAITMPAFLSKAEPSIRPSTRLSQSSFESPHVMPRMCATTFDNIRRADPAVHEHFPLQISNQFARSGAGLEPFSSRVSPAHPQRNVVRDLRF